MDASYRPSMEGVRHIDHTADLWLEASGKDLEEVISRLIEGMYGVMASSFDIGEASDRVIKVSSQDVDTGVIELLNELLFMFDAESIVLLDAVPSITITDRGVDIKVRGTVSGASVTAGEAGMEVKAVTQHGAYFKKGPEGMYGRVLLDL